MPEFSFDPKSSERLIKKLTSPDICEFLNLNALLKSPRFNASLEYALEHSGKDNDWAVFLELIGLFKNSHHYKAILSWCCDKLELVFYVQNYEIRIKENTHIADQTPSDLMTYINDSTKVGTFEEIIVRNQRKQSQEQVDLNDTQSRLPGITSQDIHEFLNLDVLLLSPRFHASLEHALEHAGKYNNWSIFLGLIGIFKCSRYYKALLSWGFDRLNWKFYVWKKEIRYRKNTHALDQPSPNLMTYIADRTKEGTLEDIIIAGQKNQPKKKKSKAKGYLDLMDTHKRLPGSFELGKRK